MFCPDRCTVPFPNVSPRDLTGKNPWRKLDARAESPERMATLARSCLSGGHLYATAAAASPRFAARTNEERTVKVSKALRILGFHFEQTFRSSHASPHPSVRPSVRHPDAHTRSLYPILRLFPHPPLPVLLLLPSARARLGIICMSCTSGCPSLRRARHWEGQGTPTSVVFSCTRRCTDKPGNCALRTRVPRSFCTPL